MSRMKWNLDLLEEVEKQHKKALISTEQVVDKVRSDLYSMTEEVWEGEDADMARDQLQELSFKEMPDTYDQIDTCDNVIQKAQKEAYESKNFCNGFPQIFRSASMPSEGDSSKRTGDLMCDSDSCEGLKGSMKAAGQNARNIRSSIESVESILASLETDFAKFDYTSYTQPIKDQTQKVAERTEMYNTAVTRYEHKTKELDHTLSNALILATPDFVPAPLDPSCLGLGDQIHFRGREIIGDLSEYDRVELDGDLDDAQIEDILSMLFDKEHVDISEYSEEDFGMAFIKLSEEKKRAMLTEMGYSNEQIDSILNSCKGNKAVTVGNSIGRTLIDEITNKGGKKYGRLGKTGKASTLELEGIREPGQYKKYAVNTNAETYDDNAGSFGRASQETKKEHEEKKKQKQNNNTNSTENATTVDYETIKNQYGFSDEEINYLAENEPELMSQIYDANGNISPDIETIYNSILAELCEYHVSQLKNADGSLKMDDICSYLQKEPLDVTLSEYLALCELFDQMDEGQDGNTQKEQFLRAGFRCEKKYTDYSTTGGGSGYYIYKRSETLEMFTHIYGKTIGLSVSDFSPSIRDGETEEECNARIKKANNRINNYNVLYAVTFLTDSTFSGGSFCTATGMNMHDDRNTLQISINNNDQDNKFTVSVKTYAQNKVTTTVETEAVRYNKEFSIYKYSFCMGDAFTEMSNEAAEGLRIDVDKIAINKVVEFVTKEILQEAVDAFNQPGFRVRFLSTGFSLVSLYTDIQKAKSEAEKQNEVIDTIQYDNNAAKYLDKINCAGTIIMDQAGNTYITSLNYDMEKVKQRVEEYNSMYPNNKVSFNEETFINDLLTDEEYRKSLDPDGSSTSFFDYWDEQENACGDQNVDVEEG